MEKFIIFLKSPLRLKSPLTPLFQRGEYSFYLLKIINNFRKRGGSKQISVFIDGRLWIMSVQF